LAPTPRLPPVNEMMIKTAWSHASLTSGTSGTISDYIVPTITNTNEYSTLVSLFGEVRLIGCTVHINSRTPYSTVAVVRTLTVGTQMSVSAGTVVAPTTLDAVINCTSVRDFSNATPTILRYRMPVPRSLEFSNIAQDSPTIPTPFAGSPGAILFYGDSFTVSSATFDIRVFAVYHLRGRQ